MSMPNAWPDTTRHKSAGTINGDMVQCGHPKYSNVVQFQKFIFSDSVVGCAGGGGFDFRDGCSLVARAMSVPQEHTVVRLMRRPVGDVVPGP